MALEGVGDLIGRDAAVVVAHADAVAAATLDQDFDAGRAGVERVLDQLFDHAGGTFDHLAGGDLSGDRWRQHRDSWPV